MTLELPRLPQSPPSHQELQVWWQRVVEAIEEQEAAQDAIITDLAATVADILAVTKRDKRTASYTSPTAVLTASDAGASATITVASHTRVYSDATELAITGGTLTGLAYSTAYAVYYDDTTLADTTPTFVASTTIADGQVGAADGRHPLGVIMTPAAAGAPVSGGGSYPPGGTVGGEIP